MRRFTLIHSYFATREQAARAKRLGMCIDTQPYLYYKDSDAIAEVYGANWAGRFIGAGEWVRDRHCAHPCDRQHHKKRSVLLRRGRLTDR